MISSGWAVSLPFPPPCPGRCAAGAMSGSCCPATGTSSNSSPILKSLGNAPPLAEMPACSLGRASTKDGLPVYVLLCPQLYDRPGNPYGDESGPRLAGQRRPLRPVCLRRGRARRRHSGQELGSGPGPRQRLAGRAGAGLPGLEGLEGPLDPDHPQPRLSGPVPAGLAAPDRRAGKLLPHRRARILRPSSRSSRAASSTPRT